MKLPSLYHRFLKISICVLFLVFITNLNAQTSYKITYHISDAIPHNLTKDKDYKMQQLDVQIKDRAKNIHYILIVNNDHSYFELEEGLEKAQSSLHEKMLYGVAKLYPSFNKEIYANYNENSIVFIRNLAARDYTVKRGFYDFEWQIKEETKQILGLEARKAKGSYKDSTTDKKIEVEAWFIPSIALQSGPDIFIGLPGLIAEVHLKQAVVTAIKIEPNPKTEVKKINDAKAMSQKEYEQLIMELTGKYIKD